jgi:hypothetical protein
LNSLKGFEIICESMVDKILDIFGKNALLSMLFQIGAGPGEKISTRLKEKYAKENFEILEAFEILLSELKEFYNIQIKEIIEDEDKMTLIIENRCFLRETIKKRSTLAFGKSFCRINKGYFETAFRNLLGDRISKIEIRYLRNDPERDACVEQLTFHKFK